MPPDAPRSAPPDHRFAQPHLRLFLSADVVGSTAFKQQNKGSDPASRPVGRASARATDQTWLHVALAFYQNIEQRFRETWHDYTSSHPHDDPDFERIAGEPPELWKTVGDEVLFTKLIEQPQQAIFCLHAWAATILELQQEMRSKHQLDLKACAWLTDFPIRNVEIALRHDVADSENLLAEDDYFINNQIALEGYYRNRSAGRFLRDFIGPSIDTGFRLGQFASPRKLILSVELAYLVATEQARSADEERRYGSGPWVTRPFVFKYDGRQVLKGVLGENPYPLIWLDLAHDSPLFKAEDQVLNTPLPTPDQIRALTDAYIVAQAPLLAFPYMPGTGPDYDRLYPADRAKLALLAQRMREWDNARQSHGLALEVVPEQAVPEPATLVLQELQLDLKR